MVKKRIIALISMIAFAVALAPAANAEAFATTTDTVNFSVAANGYPENPTKMLSNTYITMYYVRPVRAGVYEGTYGKTAKTGANGEGAVFSVEPGQIVNFVAFESQFEANNTRHFTFTSPPYKNFSAQDGNAKQLCQINYLDQETKMKIQIDNSYSCAMSMSTPITDIKIASGSAFPSDGNFDPQFGDFEVWIQRTNDPLTLVRNANVKLYDASTYQLIGEISTDMRGIASFIIARERKFYFIATAGGVTYGGYKTQYNDNPRVFYVTSDGEHLKNSFDNSTTSVMRLGGYPNTFTEGFHPLTLAPAPAAVPAPASTPAPALTPAPTPVQPISLEKPSISAPEQNQTLTNYPRRAMLIWSDVENAVNYEVAIECDYCGDSLWSMKYPLSLVSTTHWTTQPLAGDNQFRFRVRAVAGDGSRGPWSDFRYFTYSTAFAPPPVATPVTPARPYTGPARPYSAPIVPTVSLDYKYYKNGLSNTAESGSILLTVSADYSRRGYDFENNKYTGVSRGAFYVSDSNEERIPKFYANNTGQGGLVDLGEKSLNSATPPSFETKGRYYHFGTDIYLNHTYAAYDSNNNKYVLIYVTSVTGFTPKTTPVSAPAPMPASMPAPTDTSIETYDASDEDIDDFVEEGDADMQLINAKVSYGKRPRAGVKGFKFTITTNNVSEDIQRFPLETKCDVTVNNVNYALVNILNKYDQKPGKRTYSFVQNLSSRGTSLVDALKKEKGSVKCGIAIVGLIDFDTGLTISDSDTSNNAVELELKWKGGKLKTNNFRRKSM